jgi:hypothetical protein
MIPLFDDRIAPLTSEYGFIEGDISIVAEWFRDWDQSVQRARGVEVRMHVVSGSLEELLHRLEPLTSVERRRHLFVSTCSKWTAYFDNGWQGADAAVLSYAASELGCRAVRIAMEPDTMGSKPRPTQRGRFGATIFEVYGPKQTSFLNYERSIAVANDGGKWKFEQAGAPLEFECQEAYRARAVRDRFTPEMLERYLLALGIHAFDSEFFGPEARLLERRGPHAVGLREYSLREVRDYIGEEPHQ